MFLTVEIPGHGTFNDEDQNFVTIFIFNGTPVQCAKIHQMPGAFNFLFGTI